MQTSNLSRVSLAMIITVCSVLAIMVFGTCVYKLVSKMKENGIIFKKKTEETDTVPMYARGMRPSKFQ